MLFEPRIIARRYYENGYSTEPPDDLEEQRLADEDQIRAREAYEPSFLLAACAGNRTMMMGTCMYKWLSDNIEW